MNTWHVWVRHTSLPFFFNPYISVQWQPPRELSGPSFTVKSVNVRVILKKKKTTNIFCNGWMNKPMCSQGSCFRVNTEVGFGWSLQSKHFCYSTSSKMKAPVPRGKCTIKTWDVTLSWEVGATSWLLSSENTRSNGQSSLKVMRGTVLFPNSILIW